MMLMACSAVGVAGYDTGSSSERMGSADQQCLKKIRARLCREHFLMKSTQVVSSSVDNPEGCG
jgi:hypothetical protein